MKRWIWLSGLLAGLAGSLVARAGTLVQFRTVFGDVEVELYDQEKPVTVQNFLRYVSSGAYKDAFFHRQVPNFVIQGGAFVVTNRGLTDAGVTTNATFPPITNEFAFGPLISNVAGTIAMAKTSDPNSATSQFFFNLANNSTSLDDTNNSGGFTVFGRVVDGTNAFKLFNSFAKTRPQNKPWTNVVINLDGGSFKELPVLLILTNDVMQTNFTFVTNNNVVITNTVVTTNKEPYVTPNETVLMDITTLKVSVRKLESGAREISWDAVRTATNVVEYTAVFPAQWQTLETLVKPENPRPAVLDVSGDDLRFYRVRVAF